MFLACFRSEATAGSGRAGDTLLNVDRGAPEVWGSKYDVRELLRIVLKKVKGTDIEILLRDSGLIE